MTGTREIQVFEFDIENQQNAIKGTYNYLKSKTLQDIIIIDDNFLLEASDILKCAKTTIYSSLYKLKNIGAIKILDTIIKRRKTKYPELTPGTKDYWYYTSAKNRYGIDKSEIDKIFEWQKGLCGICQDSLLKENERKFHVDHDHKTGKVRGLLCGKCNVAIGLFDEDIGKMSNAMSYIIRHTI